MRRFSSAVSSVASSSLPRVTRAAATTATPVLTASVCRLSGEAVERAVSARAAINTLWAQHKNDSVSPLVAAEAGSSTSNAAAEERIAECAAGARKLMDDFKMTPQLPRDDDITHALGDAMERLLVLLVPLEPENAAYLERLLDMAARTQYEVSIRTVQHMFARTRTYAEALTLFHLFRQCNVSMNLHAYYSMVFCLQRLEEESWALRFRQERQEREPVIASAVAAHQEQLAAQKAQLAEGKTIKKKDRVKQLTPEVASAPSVQALDFILRGCDNQLMPEAKPWLGRVAFADADQGEGAMRDKAADFDALGASWTERFRSKQQ